MKEALKHLDFFLSHIRNTLLHFNHNDLNQGQLFAVGLLQRLLHASINIKYTIENMAKSTQLEFAAGLSSRAILLDTLIMLELLLLLADEEENKSKEEIENLIQTYSEKILSDSLNSTINYFKNGKIYGYYNEEKLEMLYNSFVQKYNHYLEHHELDGSQPIVRHRAKVNAADIFIKLAKNPITQDLSKIYDSYLFYSKYDHFSIMYFEVVNMPLEIKFSHLKSCVEIFISHQTNLLAILNQISDKDDFIKGQFNISLKYLHEFNG